MKICKANTPLILTDAAGGEYRVEAGATVELDAAQYEAVAAHVTLLSEEMPSEEDASAESEPEHTEKPEKNRRTKKE